jgi:hypothetical protein
MTLECVNHNDALDPLACAGLDNALDISDHNVCAVALEQCLAMNIHTTHKPTFCIRRAPTKYTTPCCS